MKKEGHPQLFKTKVSCVCGEKFETLSTKDEMRVEICSKCHPFYTGQKQKLIDSGGRVERFRRKFGIKEA